MNNTRRRPRPNKCSLKHLQCAFTVFKVHYEREVILLDLAFSSGRISFIQKYVCEEISFMFYTIMLIIGIKYRTRASKCRGHYCFFRPFWLGGGYYSGAFYMKFPKKGLFRGKFAALIRERYLFENGT